MADTFEANLPELGSIASRLEGMGWVLVTLGEAQTTDKALRTAILFLSDNATSLAGMVRAHCEAGA